MAIAAKDVMALRKATGLGMMEAKAALQEADGDMEAAIDLARKKGLAKMDTRADRAAAEGRVAAAVADDKSRGAIVEVNSETDFTASNEQFVKMAQQVANEALKQEPGEAKANDAIKQAIDEVRLTTKENIQFACGTVLGSAGKKVGSYVHFNGKVGALVEVEGEAPDDLLKELCQHICAVVPSPLGVTEDDIDQDIVAKEREIAKSQAIESGKPENIAEKMVEGKIRKFLDEVVLLRQPFIKDDKKQVKELLPKGTTITHFALYRVGGAPSEG